MDYRYFLTGLCKSLVEADKKNESGLVGKHLLVIANNKAVDYFLDQNPTAASDEFIAVAEKYGKIKDCFQKAYDANPTSEYADKIKEMVQLAAEREAEFEKMMKESESAANAPAPAPSEGANVPPATENAQ